MITESALIRRINRKFARSDLQLHKSRPSSHHELGEFYVRDTELNVIIDRWVDLEAVAREIGVMPP